MIGSLCLYSIILDIRYTNARSVMNIISKSPDRQGPAQLYHLDKDTQLTHWGIFKMLGSDFFPSSFQIKHGERVIYIDPVQVEGGEKADFILLTHTHPDHYSPKDIQALLKANTVFVCSKKLTSKLGKFKRPIHEMKPGEKLDLGLFVCEAIAAYNTKPAFLGFIYAHPKFVQNVGFVLTLPNGKRIYHLGDTHHIPEMDTVSQVDLALVPIGGRNLTMGPEEAANYCNQLQPKVVVPIHFLMSQQNDVDLFVDKLSQDIQVEMMWVPV